MPITLPMISGVLPRRPLRWPPFLCAWLLGLFACSGQGGCGSCGGGSYPDPPPPEGAMHANALVAHLQQGGVDYLARHLSDIVRAQLPTRTVGGIERAMFYLPESSFSAGIVDVTTRDGCIGATPWESCPPLNPDDGDTSAGPTYRSKVELNLNTLDTGITATFAPGSGATPDGIQITLQNVDLFVDLALVLEGVDLLGDATCYVHDAELTVPAIHLDRMAFTLTLAVDAQNRFTTGVSDVQVEIGSFLNSDLLNLDVSPCNGGVCNDPTCHNFLSGFNCSLQCGLSDFVFTAANFLTGVLTPMLEWLAPTLLEQVVTGMLQDYNNQPLALAGSLDVAALSSGVSSGSLFMDPSALLWGAVPNDDAFVVSGPIEARGMRLSFDMGAFAPPSACAPRVSVPAFAARVGPAPFFDGTLERDGHVENYHVALTLSEALAAQGAYAIYSMGSECLWLSMDALGELSGGALTLGTLSLLVPALAEWGEANSPLMFQVHPAAAPSIHLGTGAVTGHDAQGNPIVDSLIQLDLGDLGLSIYALIDNEMVRLATVAADVRLGLNVERTPDNHLQIGLDGLTIANVVEVYDEMMPAADYGVLLEVLLTTTLGSLIEGVASFDLDLAPMLSELLGGAEVYARINTVERLGEPPQAYLATYLTFCEPEDLTDPAKPPCYTPPAPPLSASAQLLHVERGGLALQVEPGHTVQIRVDGGPWSGFRGDASGRAQWQAPLLHLPGLHRVEVRERLANHYWTRTEASTTLRVWID